MKDVENSFFLSIGSNQNPEKNILTAIQKLKTHFIIEKVSSIYETDPVGPAGDEKFWNCAIRIKTKNSRKKTKELLQKIENNLGRVRQPNKYAPRPIDIDILPYPGYQSQAFVIIPLEEISQNETDEETGESFKEIASQLKQESKNYRVVQNAKELS